MKFEIIKDYSDFTTAFLLKIEDHDFYNLRRYTLNEFEAVLNNDKIKISLKLAYLADLVDKIEKIKENPQNFEIPTLKDLNNPSVISPKLKRKIKWKE